MPAEMSTVTMGAPFLFVRANDFGNTPWRAASNGVSAAMIT